MADIDTSITLDGIHAAILAQITAAFPDFKTVEFYREDEDRQLPTPACLLDMEEIEPDLDNDAGTGQLPVLLRFSARIIMGRIDPQVKINVRKAAAALAVFLHNRHWGTLTPGINADECRVTLCMRDEFDPVMDQWAVWRVEWNNRAFLGDSAWNNDGTVPTSYFSFSPDIGIPNEDKYEPAVPNEP